VPKTYTGEKAASSKNGVEITGYPLEKMTIDLYLLSCTKFNSKWIKDLNVRSDILKLLEKNIGRTLEDISIGNIFLNRTPVVQEIRAIINKWDCIKLKSFCPTKETITRMNRQPTE
jgi:hypothetical protein